MFTYKKSMVSLNVPLAPSCFAKGQNKSEFNLCEKHIEVCSAFFLIFTLTFRVFIYFNTQIKQCAVRLLLSGSGVVQRQDLKTAARFRFDVLKIWFISYKCSWTLTERVAFPVPFAVTLKSLFISTWWAKADMIKPSK